MWAWKEHLACQRRGDWEEEQIFGCKRIFTDIIFHQRENKCKFNTFLKCWLPLRWWKKKFSFSRKLVRSRSQNTVFIFFRLKHSFASIHWNLNTYLRHIIRKSFIRAFIWHRTIRYLCGKRMTIPPKQMRDYKLTCETSNKWVGDGRSPPVSE